MLVCSCNYITDHDIRDVINELLDEDCWQLIVPAKVYHAMQKRGRCCGCFPTVVDLIVKTTEEYHARRHSTEAELFDFMSRLHEFHAKHRRVDIERRQKVIEQLNEALFLELGAVNQYWLHYRLLEDWGFTKLAKKERAESIEEMQHADKLISRIIFLEGHPNLQTVAPLRIGQNVKEVLEADLAGEYDARTAYKKARDICREAGDYVSMKLFEDLLIDEEGHIDFLETQLDLLNKIGEGKYGQLNADSADEAE